MRNLCILFLFSTTIIFSQTAPLSQRQACTQFSEAVVPIDAAGQSLGTGFFVSPDGLILTAAHVLRDNSTGQYYQTITVTMPDGHLEFAKFAIVPTAESAGKDFALLKVDTAKPLPFLVLGDENEVVLGAEATIIGFPFSAITANTGKRTPKFCLNASFAASEQSIVPVKSSTPVLNARNPAMRSSSETDVKVNIIYFQGPSIKGISGSPIIARDSGHVVGIVVLTLAGIDASLKALKQETEVVTASGGKATIFGVDPLWGFNRIVTVLDQQLVNGLGAATGIDDPKDALKHAQHKKK